MLRTDCNSHAQACWWLECIQCCVCCLQQHCCSLPRYQLLSKWEFPTATEAVTHCKVSAVHHGTRTHARTHLSTHMNNWGSQSNQVNMHISRIGEGKEEKFCRKPDFDNGSIGSWELSSRFLCRETTKPVKVPLSPPEVCGFWHRKRNQAPRVVWSTSAI